MYSFSIVPPSFKLVSGTTTCFTHEINSSQGDTLSLCAYNGEEIHGNIIIGTDKEAVLLLDDSFYISQFHPKDTIRVSASEYFEFCYLQKVIDDDRFEKADLIRKDSFIEVEANSFSQIFFTLNVPYKKKKLNEEIKIYISENGKPEKLAKVLTLKVDIFNYEPTENKFFSDFWLHPTHIARAHRVRLWSEDHFALIDKYVEKLSELNQKTAMLILSEIPWRGQYCSTERRTKANMFEYSMIKVKRAANRKFVYDFSVVDRILDIYNKYSCFDEISVYGLSGVWDAIMPDTRKSDHLDGILIRYIDQSDGKAKYMKHAKDIDDYIRAIEKYFIKKSLIAKVRLVADEPADVEKYIKILKHLKEITPSFKYKSAVCTLDFINKLSGEITDLAPSISVLCNEYDNIIKLKSKHRRMLYYVCCNPPYPNTFIRSDLTEAYFLPIIVSLAGLDGFLRWAFTAWPDDPENEPRYFAWPAGDLFLVYPGKDGAPASTIRFEALKYGIFLYGLLEDLKNRCGEETYKKAISIVFNDTDIRHYFNEHNPVERDKIFKADFGAFEEMKRFALKNITETK